MAIVLIQSYEPVPELDGKDGLMPCDRALAARLVKERRAEIMAPGAEPFRYVRGTAAYTAMREQRRGNAFPVPTEPDKRKPEPAAPDQDAPPAPRRAKKATA